MSEKRSQAAGNAQLYLLPDLAPEGVGARQGTRPAPRRGGGYLNACTAPEFSKNSAAPKNPGRDPRLDELRAMGVQRVWVEVAAAIGVDAFLAAWRIIDADPSCSCDGAMLKVPLRSWRGYLRYQRNRYIEAMSAAGTEPHEIRRRLQRQLGETVSIRHIQRIAAAG